MFNVQIPLLAVRMTETLSKTFQFLLYLIMHLLSLESLMAQTHYG